MAVNFWSVFVRDLDGLPPHAFRQKPIFRTYCGVKLLSIKLTAGRAKKEIPRRAHPEAISFPFQDFGTASP